ncbi:MAG: alpha-1,4-glucan--maltose-1-phosphate maltosyltransferase [Candidatus Dormibacteria bacterium]
MSSPPLVVASRQRVVIEHVRPSVDGGAFPAKGQVGVPLLLAADVFGDGHDLVTAWVSVAGGGEVSEVPMVAAVNDRWEGFFRPGAMGMLQFTVHGMVDTYATWLRDLGRRLEAGQDVELEFEEGALLAEASAARATTADARALRKLASTLRRQGRPGSRLAAAAGLDAVALVARSADRAAATASGPWQVWVDRERGGFSAWYEFFPRSEGATGGRGGTLAAAALRLPEISRMGFDVVYLPPIHPIGSTFRKGPNNTLHATEGDPGSPWAIGAAAGGHTAVHPDLGSLDDFDEFVAAASAANLEVALDYALQCSPDHPWVTEHPRWFRHRPDGSIRHAENPPKRYQDIYPFNFDSEDRDNLWLALREVLLFWVGHGVRIFRVDNPHTKPLPFWEWLISAVRAEHPEVLFLAEAFTRPRLMQRLAKAGFTQSYTYFTWRNARWELEEYLQELSQTEMVDWFRPNFWVNTPDILHQFLQLGGEPAFRLRAVLAAMAGPSWGMYSGYELGENLPARAGSEEYMDSEKYQYRPRDYSNSDLVPFFARVNEIRRRHMEPIALLRNLKLHHVDGDQLLCFSRCDDSRKDVLLVIVNLDPHNVREGSTALDLPALGLPWDAEYRVTDELTDASYNWRGAHNYVRLDPRLAPAHVFRVEANV